MVQKIAVCGDKIIINDKVFKIPNNKIGHKVSQIGDRLYIDGYELTPKGKWRINLRSLWHYIF